jgi:hypothetical protein
MNKLERQMTEMLKRGRDEFGWAAVKAEFEAEGTRLDELLRLVEIAHRADMAIAVKIGGCEALMDLFEAKQIGVNYIIAPMIETAYALSKFEIALKKAYSPDDREDTEFLWNIETTTGFQNRKEMAELAAQSGALAGVVFGRSDYCGSIGLNSDNVNDDKVIDDVIEVAKVCESHNLDVVVGGGVSVDSLPALRRIRDVKLTRFETRKIIMWSEALDRPNIDDGMLLALQFELKWLTNKREYYNAIFNEDEKRFTTLKTRWNLSD